MQVVVTKLTEPIAILTQALSVFLSEVLDSLGEVLFVGAILGDLLETL